MPARLVPAPRIAAWIIAACVVVVATLGAIVHDTADGTGFDNAVDGWVMRHIGHKTLELLLDVTTPGLVVGLLAMIAFGAFLARRWSVIALVALAPALATVLTEVVLKPFVHRTNSALGVQFHHVSYAYPSGHETGVSSLLAVVGLLVWGSHLRTRTKAIVAAVLAVVYLVSLVALVGLFYHFATDVIGALGVSAGCVLGVALAIDALLPRMTAARRDEPMLVARSSDGRLPAD